MTEQPWHRHPRADRRPILGATPAERLARLHRLRAAFAAVSWDAAQANQYAHAAYGVVGLELLTAGEADALLAALEASAAAKPSTPVEDKAAAAASREAAA